MAWHGSSKPQRASMSPQWHGHPSLPRCEDSSPACRMELAPRAPRTFPAPAIRHLGCGPAVMLQCSPRPRLHPRRGAGARFVPHASVVREVSVECVNTESRTREVGRPPPPFQTPLYGVTSAATCPSRPQRASAAMCLRWAWASTAARKQTLRCRMKLARCHGPWIRGRWALDSPSLSATADA
jgi:hypothetical protein